jgi:hypothetical protein
MALNMDGEAHKTGWQHDLRDHWLLVSAGYFAGCISPSLDDFLTESERITIILRTAERSIQALRAFGAFVPAAFLNTLGITDSFTADWPIEWCDRIADRFTALLRGDLATDASTSPVLPAVRQGQRWDEIEQPRNA